jgi:hypothetical protein
MEGKQFYSSKGLQIRSTHIQQSLYRPGQALRAPGLKLPEFPEHQHMKVVKLSPQRAGSLYPQKIFLVYQPIPRQ